MCGIIGYAGMRAAAPLLIDGLQQLEYRGYDSAGIAVISQNGTVSVKKAAGKLSCLRELVGDDPPEGTIGIGHTRWATHGAVSDLNAHPQLDCAGDVVVIHNGIIENYLELKQQLLARGHCFASQTDTEVVCHLVEEQIAGGAELPTAVRAAMAPIQGANAFLVLCRSCPDQFVAVRLGNAGGIVVGVGERDTEGETFVASDLPAILPHTRKVVFLDNGELALVRAGSPAFFNLAGEALAKVPVTVPWDPVAAVKGGYRHFMLKEIHEQPRAITDTIRGRIGFEPPESYLEDFPFSDEEIAEFRRVVIVGCGTAWHASLVGKYLIESLVRIPVEVDYGSEFRYRETLLDPTTLMISVSQSGETVDTLAAMETARERGVKQITVCNTIGAQTTRSADGVIYTHAGPEIGVASTKCFTAQMVALYLLATYLGRRRGTIAGDRMRTLIDDLARLPHLLGNLLALDNAYARLAQQYAERRDFLFIGRGINYPIALEGALKLKEISYIHAEGYPAGEMKHGPIALIDQSMPVVAIAIRDHLREKMISQIEQVKARSGIVIALATEGDDEIAAKADHTLFIPAVVPLLSPVLTVAPLQLLAYHIAVRLGKDVDQPRNLAKSVTVE